MSLSARQMKSKFNSAAPGCGFGVPLPPRIVNQTSRARHGPAGANDAPDACWVRHVTRCVNSDSEQTARNLETQTQLLTIKACLKLCLRLRFQGCGLFAQSPE